MRIDWVEDTWNFYKDKFVDETCIVMGNGPSLKTIPNSFLKSYCTFGTNRIFLRNNFTPDFYVSVNPIAIEDNIKEINKVESVRFINEDFRTGIVGSIPIKRTFDDFGTDPNIGFSQGCTVTYVCLQIAYWMGFETVLLVGVDHHYKFKGKPNEIVVSKGNDPNHFSKYYFPKGMKWQLPDLLNSEKYYEIARSVYENKGRKIINLTNPTKLDVFPKRNWREYNDA